MPTVTLNNTPRAVSLQRRLGIEDVQRQQRGRVLQAATGVLGGTALALLLLPLTHSFIISAAVIGVLVATPVLLGWLWRDPVRGVYVLLGAAALCPEYPDPRDMVGKLLPFFVDLKQWTHTGVIFSAAEILMTLTLLVWLLKGIARRDLRFDRGSLMRPIGLYMLLVLVAEIHGVTSGGDIRTSLWEVRSQAYMLIAYILTCNLVKTRSQVMTLIWALLIPAGWRSIQGTYDYFTYIRPMRGLGTIIQELGPHEQAYFFNGFLTVALVFALYAGPRRMRRFTVLLLPFLIIAEMAEQRRAAMLALGVMLVAVMVFTWIQQPKRRRAIGWITFAILVVFPPYYMAFRNSTSVWATPARAFASNFQPSDRDKESNQYRVVEDEDIMATAQASPIIGFGFGKPMLNPFGLVIGYDANGKPVTDPLTALNVLNVSTIYEWAYIMPHNSILWVWMRLGTLGYLMLWFMIGLAVMQITRLLSHAKDRSLQGLALFVLLMIVQQVIISYVDLQWSNYRTMLATGVLFALISRVAALVASEKSAGEGAEPDSEPRPKRGRSFPVAAPVPLAVVDGRLRTVAKR